MILWLDAQLSPTLAPWLSSTFHVSAVAVRDLGLRDADDPAILRAAGAAGAVVLTKDRDFVDLLDRHGPPPQVIWVTVGNTSNARMREVLLATFDAVQAMLDDGAPKLATGAKMRSETVRAETREGDIGTELGEIAKAHPEVTIGSYPFFDDKRGPNTNVVLRLRDPQKLAAAKAAVEEMLKQVRATL